MKLHIRNVAGGLLALTWMGVIYFLSSRPPTDYPPLFWGADKVIHIAVYAVLGVLVAIAVGHARGTNQWSRIWLVTALVTVYGVSDEFHQSFVPGREPSVGDILADAFGGFVAAVVMFRLRTSMVARGAY